MRILKPKSVLRCEYETIGELPEPLRILAMRRCLEYHANGSSKPETIKDLLETKIRSAFSWTGSPDGPGFWSQVIRGEIVNFDQLDVSKKGIKLNVKF